LKPHNFIAALRGAEAPLFHGIIAGRGGAQNRIKVQEKGNGQECPFRAFSELRLHVGNPWLPGFAESESRINGNDAAGVGGSHLSQKRRKMGHPPLFWRRPSGAEALFQEHSL